MRVLRVETPAGRGMYSSTPDRTACWAGAAGLDTYADERHPMPYNDSQFMREWEEAGCPDHAGWVFGFLHEEQLRSWLYDDKVRQRLKDLGLQLNVYSVPSENVLSGYTQLTFWRNRAKHLGALDLVTLQPI